MTEQITKSEAVGKLVSLAKEVEIKDPIDWTGLNLKEDTIYEMMAENVINQIYSVPETHRETVTLATMTKLLVENFSMNLKIQMLEKEKKNATSTNRS